MTTKEERAEEYANRMMSGLVTTDWGERQINSIKDRHIKKYIEIATEQEAIAKQEMIEKSCELYCSAMCGSSDNEKPSCNTPCGGLEHFRKAMEL